MHVPLAGASMISDVGHVVGNLLRRRSSPRRAISKQVNGEVLGKDDVRCSEMQYCTAEAHYNLAAVCSCSAEHITLSEAPRKFHMTAFPLLRAMLSCAA